MRLRHRQAGALRFEGTVVRDVDTGRPLSESIHVVRQAVWQLLSSTNGRPFNPQPGVHQLRRLRDGLRRVPA